MDNKHKPLSPHITIYRWQVTNVLSIMHRMSGIVIFLLTIMYTIAAILSVYYKNIASDIVSTSVGQNVLKFIIGITAIVTIYHIIHGIRYLYFDLTANITNKSIDISAYIAMSATIIISIMIIQQLIKSITI